MGVPSNIVFTQGTGAPPITADNLNTFVQTMTTLAGARGFTGTANQQIFLQGYSSAGDGGQGNFEWNPGTGTDDGGITTIVPTGSTAGYWSRIGNSSVVYTPQTFNSTSGGTYTAANVVNQILIRSGAAAVNDTFPTASAIIATFLGSQPSAMRDLIVINENSGTLTISPGSGVTFSGNLSGGNFTIATVTQHIYKIYYASASAVTVYG